MSARKCPKCGCVSPANADLCRECDSWLAQAWEQDSIGSATDPDNSATFAGTPSSIPPTDGEQGAGHG